MTTFDLDEYALSALRNGASGFLLKDTQPAELVSSLRAVASGDAVVSPSVTRRLLDRFLGAAGGQLRDQEVLNVLTEREREVLVLIAKGLSNTEIAGTLFLSEATVKTHVGRILAKLDLRDRVQAVVLAYETGLVRPGDDVARIRVPLRVGTDVVHLWDETASDHGRGKLGTRDGRGRTFPTGTLSSGGNGEAVGIPRHTDEIVTEERA